MDGLTIEHPLFELIKKEHSDIIAYLECLDRNPNLNNLHQLIQYLWDFAEETHHYKEEILLFTAVADNPKITEGGPLCSLYFDFHMADKPIDRSKKIKGKEPLLESHQATFYQKSSPLRIPIDEHRSGKELLKYTIENWDKLGFNNIKNNLIQYRHIQIFHFKKEETCLLFLCAYLLTPTKADKILESWNRDTIHATYL